MTNRGQTRMWNAYTCLTVPHLRLGGLVFRDGWLISDNPDEQASIVQEPLYGSAIFSWGWSLSYPGPGFDKETANPVKPRLAEKIDGKISDRLYN